MKPDVSEPPSADARIVIEPLAAPPTVRRAADVLRLVLALAVLLVGLLVATLAHQGVRSTERGLLDTVVTLPPSLRDSLTAAVQLVVVVMPATIAVAVAVRRRFAAVGKLVVAGAVGTIAGVIVSHLWLGDSHPSTWHELLTGRNGIVAVTIPPVAWLAGTAAVVAVAGAELSWRWRRWLWWLTGITAAIEVIVGGFLPVDAVVAALWASASAPRYCSCSGSHLADPQGPRWSPRSRSAASKWPRSKSCRPQLRARRRTPPPLLRGLGWPYGSTQPMIATVSGWPV